MEGRHVFTPFPPISGAYAFGCLCTLRHYSLVIITSKQIISLLKYIYFVLLTDRQTWKWRNSLTAEAFYICHNIYGIHLNRPYLFHIFAGHTLFGYGVIIFYFLKLFWINTRDIEQFDLVECRCIDRFICSACVTIQ